MNSFHYAVSEYDSEEEPFCNSCNSNIHWTDQCEDFRKNSAIEGNFENQNQAGIENLGIEGCQNENNDEFFCEVCGNNQRKTSECEHVFPCENCDAISAFATDSCDFEKICRTCDVYYHDIEQCGCGAVLRVLRQL